MGRWRWTPTPRRPRSARSPAPSNLDVYQAARGILDIVNENMFGALRLVTVQKGLDPRDFALVAFGGAGPLHGNALGILAGCFPVIVPPTPGVLSALGFLCSDAKNEFARTYIRTIDEADPADVRTVLEALGEQARSWLRDEGVSEAEQSVRFEADVRYLPAGLRVLPRRDAGSARPTAVARALHERFGARHEQLYGFRLDHPVELVNLRAVGRGERGEGQLPPLRARKPRPPRRRAADETRVYFGRDFAPALVYDRARLRSGHIVPGAGHHHAAGYHDRHSPRTTSGRSTST